jgi:hypothetical protein
MPAPRFRFVCSPSALAGVAPEWRRDMLAEGELALLADEGLDAIDHVAHELGQLAILLVRRESDHTRQEQTVMAYAESLPLVWVAPAFGERARRWAAERGPMTLLSASAGGLNAEERQRIDRFLAILSRQSE